jgi:hypothetical protein
LIVFKIKTSNRSVQTKYQKGGEKRAKNCEATDNTVFGSAEVVRIKWNQKKITSIYQQARQAIY